MSDPGKAKLPKPSRRATPQELYCDYLPRLFDALFAGQDWMEQVFDIGVEVEGEPFTVMINAGKVTARPGAAEGALATFRSDMRSWTLAARDLLPRVIRYANDNLERIGADITAYGAHHAADFDPDTMQKMSGLLKLEFTDDAGDVGHFDILIGDGSGAQARIETHDADLWALLDTSGQLVSILKSRAQLHGDVGWVIRLARYLETPGS